MKQDSHSNLHRHVMGSNTLICFVVFFRRSAFCRALLESKTHTPVLVILATKTHYPNSHRPQQTSCVTLVGHLNNTYASISRKKKTQLDVTYYKQRLATINRVAAVWAGKYGVCKCTANPKETKTRRRNACVMTNNLFNTL